MRVCFAFVLVVLVAQTSWAAPKRAPCRGLNCRRIPQKATKAGIRTPATRVATSAPKVTTPAPGSVKKNSSSGGRDPTAEGGWLTAPTTAAPTPKTTPKAKTNKPGICGLPKSYGIKCTQTFDDQCKHDADCPELSKCCMVGECGYLCVSPKTKGDVEDKTLPAKTTDPLSKNEVEEEDQYIFTSEEVEGDKDSFSTVKTEDKIVMDEKNSTSKNIAENSATSQKTRSGANKNRRTNKGTQQKVREGKSEENEEEESEPDVKAEETVEEERQSDIKAKESVESEGEAKEETASSAKEEDASSGSSKDAK